MRSPIDLVSSRGSQLWQCLACVLTWLAMQLGCGLSARLKLRTMAVPLPPCGTWIIRPSCESVAGTFCTASPRMLMVSVVASPLQSF